MKTSTMKIALAVVALLTAIHLAGADENGWTTDYKKALAQASAEKKFVLIDFNGVPWCRPCVALEREILSSKKFLDYSAKKFVLIKVNFPSPFSEPSTGLELAKKYLPGDEVMLPTEVVLSPDGRKLGETGYQPGGPDVFIKEIERIVKK